MTNERNADFAVFRIQALACLSCLLCLALAWSGLCLSCLPCQQQQQRRRSRRRPPKVAGCCCWTRPRQGRQDRPRPDQAKARHNRQASQAKAGFWSPNMWFYTGKCTKIIKNAMKQVEVARYGLILWENVATGSGKPLECPPGPKTPQGAQGGPGGPTPLRCPIPPWWAALRGSTSCALYA